MGIGAYGIDLGTDSIKIYSSYEDNIFVKRNMIAIQNKNLLFAFGDEAYEMFEKAPANIHILHPLSNGVIGDIKNMQVLFKLFISQIAKDGIKPSEYYVAIPTDITEVEKRAFFDLVKEANVKAKKIYVVEKAVADGIGLGVSIDVKNAHGVIIVNVGYDTTEISILSFGKIVLSKLIKIGGKKFDETIKSAIRKEKSLLIGSKSAENVKVSLCDLTKKNESAIVFGRDIVTGWPVEKSIETAIIDKALKENFDVIIDSIKVIFERTPPELSADIFKNGIYLTGAASSVNRLSELLSKGTGLKVNCVVDPGLTVAKGLEIIIKDDKYKSVVYEIEGMSR